MADIQFDEEQQYQPAQQIDQKPLLVRLVLATGIVSDERSAEYVLLGIAVVATILAISIFVFSGNGGSKASVPPLPPMSSGYVQ